MPYQVGLDLGTTHCKAVARSQSDAILGVAQAGYRIHS